MLVSLFDIKDIIVYEFVSSKQSTKQALHLKFFLTFTIAHSSKKINV
jgi:hypothetical protein